MTECSRCGEVIREKQYSSRGYAHEGGVYCIRCYHEVEVWGEDDKGNNDWPK